MNRLCVREKSDNRSFEEDSIDSTASGRVEPHARSEAKPERPRDYANVLEFSADTANVAENGATREREEEKKEWDEVEVGINVGRIRGKVHSVSAKGRARIGASHNQMELTTCILAINIRKEKKRKKRKKTSDNQESLKDV
ncbi:hypothetical protein OUZ56_018927 [Daphnia magna]|uniref:Uncharacterized protein n=1 Tax=Daphnia magna TaxID=35525 RepID=A0ABQ9ZA48_9CRUS|nr:hypothetical protein OUZ56_018927 [Daphnia magna]